MGRAGEGHGREDLVGLLTALDELSSGIVIEERSGISLMIHLRACLLFRTQSQRQTKIEIEGKEMSSRSKEP